MSDILERPVWKVYIENFNKNCIEEYNIFDHDYFWAGCQAAWNTARCFSEDTEEQQIVKFKDMVAYEVVYYFWAKIEWEIILTTPISRNKFKDIKIDVCSQIELNYEQFFKYLWNWFMEKELKKNG